MSNFEVKATSVGAEKADVGYCILTFGYDIEFGGRFVTLTDLYLTPKYRRCGLGRRTLELVEAICFKKKLRILELQVKRSNTLARKFYKSLGFIAHDRIPQSKLLEGRSSRDLTQQKQRTR